MFRPDAHALLAVAHESLVRDLLPQLPHDARYCGLMVANAMAIALRELAAAVALAEASSALGAAAIALDEVSAEVVGWADAERHLARHIRRSEAAADPRAQAGIYRALRAAAHARLAIDNPRELPAYSSVAGPAS